LSSQDGAGLGLPAIPYLIASRALGSGSRDGVATFVDFGRAGAFGELSAVENVVVVVSVVGLGLPAVADSVVGCALGFGDGDDVVAFGCCVLGELAFFYGEGLGEFVLDVEGLGDVGLGGWLVFFFSYWTMETIWCWDELILQMGSMLTFDPVTGKASTTAPKMAKTKATSKRISMMNGFFNERGVK
jgi:hypothetical protein